MEAREVVGRDGVVVGHRQWQSGVKPVTGLKVPIYIAISVKKVRSILTFGIVRVIVEWVGVTKKITEV